MLCVQKPRVSDCQKLQRTRGLSAKVLGTQVWESQCQNIRLAQLPEQLAVRLSELGALVRQVRSPRPWDTPRRPGTGRA